MMVLHQILNSYSMIGLEMFARAPPVAIFPESPKFGAVCVSVRSSASRIKAQDHKNMEF